MISDLVGLPKNDNTLILSNYNLKRFKGFENKKINSLKFNIPNYGIIPEGKQGAGNKAWTFIDEIIIN
jgi:hexosaminidase